MTLDELLAELEGKKKSKTTRMHVSSISSIGLVDEGACEGSIVLTAKKRATMTDENGQEVSAADAAMLKLRAIAAELKKANPKLTDAQAMVRAAATPEGQPYAGVARAIAARTMTAKKYHEKVSADVDTQKRCASVGADSWRGAEAALVRKFASARPGGVAVIRNLEWARAQVRQSAPAVVQLADQERKAALGLG